MKFPGNNDGWPPPLASADRPGHQQWCVAVHRYGDCDEWRVGRCDRALERGMDAPRWSTRWTG